MLWVARGHAERFVVSFAKNKFGPILSLSLIQLTRDNVPHGARKLKRSRGMQFRNARRTASKFEVRSSRARISRRSLAYELLEPRLALTWAGVPPVAISPPTEPGFGRSKFSERRQRLGQHCHHRSRLLFVHRHHQRRLHHFGHHAVEQRGHRAGRIQRHRPAVGLQRRHCLRPKHRQPAYNQSHRRHTLLRRHHKLRQFVARRIHLVDRRTNCRPPPTTPTKTTIRWPPPPIWARSLQPERSVRS